MFARSSAVGTLMMGSTMAGAAGIGLTITADCNADVVSPVRTGLRATRRGVDCIAAGAGAGLRSPPATGDGLALDLAASGSTAGSVTGFDGFLASGLAALAVSLSVSPKIFVIELLRPLPAPTPMAAPAAAAACSVKAWP